MMVNQQTLRLPLTGSSQGCRPWTGAAPGTRWWGWAPSPQLAGPRPGLRCRRWPGRCGGCPAAPMSHRLNSRSTCWQSETRSHCICFGGAAGDNDSWYRACRRGVLKCSAWLQGARTFTMVVVWLSFRRPAGTSESSRRSISDRRRALLRGALRCISLDSIDSTTLHNIIISMPIAQL